MNIGMVQGEIVQERESLVEIRLDVGYGEPIVQVHRDKLIKKLASCSFCGEATPLPEPGQPNPEMAAHIVRCDKHPMGKMAVAMILMEDALKSAEHALTVRQGMVCDFEKSEPEGPSECKMYDTATLAQIDAALKACGSRKS